MDEPTSRDKQRREPIVLANLIVPWIGQSIVEEWNSIHITFTGKRASIDSIRQFWAIQIGHFNLAQNHAKRARILHSSKQHRLQPVNAVLVIVERSEWIVGTIDDGIAQIKINLDLHPINCPPPIEVIVPIQCHTLVYHCERNTAFGTC